jgi:hypothetical protein
MTLVNKNAHLLNNFIKLERFISIGVNKRKRIEFFRIEFVIEFKDANIVRDLQFYCHFYRGDF